MNTNAIPLSLFAAVVLNGMATTPLLHAQLDDSAWKQALATYQQWVQRPSLWKRTEGRVNFAETGDPRALDLLIRSYTKPEEPADYNRYLITSIAMRAFRGKADEAVLSQWRARHQKAEDAWMWYETLRPDAHFKFEELRSIVRGKGDQFLRAAAMEVLARSATEFLDQAPVAQLCLEVLNNLPKREPERGLLTESVAQTLVTVQRHMRGDTWRPVTEAVINQFDLPETSQRTKVVLSRLLAQAFGVTNLGFESHWWRTELTRAVNSRPQTGTTVVVPFFTINAIGQRFVYVIDASDSMCLRVSDREKRELGPTTGPSRKKPETPGGFVPKETDLDWNRIVTRFDVGREFVRLSLESLQPDHLFAIVLFGDSAEPLAATPRLIPANQRNVRAAIAELQAMELGRPAPNRPDGVLRGRTNMHAGLRCAFELTRAGATRSPVYVDPRARLEGCDSIFLLSDGAPSWDDWPAQDARDPHDQAGDPETGQRFQNVDRLLFQGPFSRPPFFHLVKDIERMNLFRKAEIHCVGIGEANHHLLQQIARIGGGQALKIEGQGR